MLMQNIPKSAELQIPCYTYDMKFILRMKGPSVNNTSFLKNPVKWRISFGHPFAGSGKGKQVLFPQMLTNRLWINIWKG